MEKEDYERVRLENEQVFETTKAMMLSRLLNAVGTESLAGFAKTFEADAGVDHADLVHRATDHLDLTRPSVLNGIGAAILEALTAGQCGDIRHESPPSEMLGAMSWSVYCFLIDAGTQWVEERYGEAAADDFYSAIEEHGLEWNNRAEAAKAAKSAS